MSYAITRTSALLTSLALSLGLLSGASGCADAVDDVDDDVGAAASAVVQGATIQFAADYSEQVSGSLIDAQPIAIDYDDNRLTTCRGYKYGQPAWSIVAHYTVDGGPLQTLPVAGPNVAAPPSLSVPAGNLEMWFVNSDVWGCVAYDSDYGQNYAFQVNPAGVAWAGLESSVISRCSDQGQPCAGDLVPLAQGFMFDTWARQRAVISNAYFEAWEPGVTDWDNPNLWQQLDVQVHYRFDPAAPFSSAYVNFDQRLGNNARYALSVRGLDPFGGNTITDPANCPSFPYWLTPDTFYVEAQIELYFTINGQELRPAPGAVYSGTYQDYAGLYAICP